MLARSSRLFGIALGLGALVLSAASCDKESAKTTTVAKHRPVARRASASAQQLAHRAKAAPEARAKATPPAAGDRDPFARPSLERPPVTQLRCEGHVALREHGLSELELTAVVSGDSTRALAMLRVRGGNKTATVKRGQRVGKSCLRVKSIHKDRVVLEVQRAVDAEQRRADHVIALRPTGKRS
jgi:Tfp pilus assembly protein PilP